MAISNIGETWHLRYLESYVALLLELKELSKPQKVRDSKNIKPAIEHAEDAINQPNLLTEPEKTVIKEFLSELQFTYHACSDKAGNDKYVCETIGGSNWRYELIVLEARIKGSFFPKIQQMAFSRTTGLKASDNKAGDKMGQIQYQDFLVKIAQQVDDLLIQDTSAFFDRFNPLYQNYVDKRNKRNEWYKQHKANGGIRTEGKRAFISSTNEEIPPELEDPDLIFLHKIEFNISKGFSEPKSKEEEEQRDYIILAVIRDKMFPDRKKIIKDDNFDGNIIWHSIYDEPWDDCRQRAFIEQALERVKADINNQKEQPGSGNKDLTDTEQNNIKIVKLTDFMRNYCEKPLSVESKTNRIHTFVKSKKIRIMPKPVNKTEGNQTKLYRVTDLKAVWGNLQKIIKSLPNLKD